MTSTVQLQDGGAGDASPATDAVIADPSGPSTRDRSITVAVVSGAGAPNFTFKLESCPGTATVGAAGAPPTLRSRRAGRERRPGPEHRARQHRRLELGRHRVHAAEPEPALPPLGHDAPPGVGLEPHRHQLHRRDQQNGNSDLANARNIYLAEHADRPRRPAPATFATERRRASRCTRRATAAANGSVNNLAGASFQAYSNATYTTAVPGATCTTDGTGTCVVGGLSRTPPTTSARPPRRRTSSASTPSPPRAVVPRSTARASPPVASGSNIEHPRLRQPADQPGVPERVRHQHRPRHGPLQLHQRRRARRDEDVGQGLRHRPPGHAVEGRWIHLRHQRRRRAATATSP